VTQGDPHGKSTFFGSFGIRSSPRTRPYPDSVVAVEGDAKRLGEREPTSGNEKYVVGAGSAGPHRGPAGATYT
jgi:hypothetical protein